jgi:phosphoribosylamine--glycine ligase
MKVLVVGGGAREHALTWKLKASPLQPRLWCAPGNAGTASVARSLPMAAEDLEGLLTWSRTERPDLVVVGPEAPLVAGLADRLRAAGISVFGPSAAAARIEGSKVYAREVMARAGVPQPQYACIKKLDQALRHLMRLEAAGINRVVVKASGLAAGKGAIVCDTLAQARIAAEEMLEHRSFGDAGSEILIEERLEGEEASLLAVTDGTAFVPFAAAQDYKRALDGDQGMNTGGIGAYAPAPVMTSDLGREAATQILAPTLRALREEGRIFQGCLYGGLMRTPTGLKVIEFNCRFGDPETQALMPLLETDLLPVLTEAALGRLTHLDLSWRAGCAVGVVLCSGGYPGSYQSGLPIRGLDQAGSVDGVTVFHAATRERDGEFVTAGGRVLTVTAVGETFAQARDRAYAAAEMIRFEGMHYRTDIAARVADG